MLKLFSCCNRAWCADQASGRRWPSACRRLIRVSEVTVTTTVHCLLSVTSLLSPEAACDVTQCPLDGSISQCTVKRQPSLRRGWSNEIRLRGNLQLNINNNISNVIFFIMYCVKRSHLVSYMNFHCK